MAYDLDVEVSHSEVINSIKELSDNKSCGLDGIHAEHLKHCSDRIIPMLSKCFTGLLVHGTLPESMIAVVLVPIVKNKRASICSKSNYRPIALASIVSKIFEKLLYDRLYTCELWCQYRSESLRKLCVAYNNVFRFLCREPRNCSASHMFVSRGLPTCNMLIRKSIYAFMTSTKRSCNSILQNIVGSDHIYTSPLRQHWRRMLYVHAY